MTKWASGGDKFTLKHILLAYTKGNEAVFVNLFRLFYAGSKNVSVHEELRNTLWKCCWAIRRCVEKMLCLMNFQTHRSSSGMLFHFQILHPSLAGNTQIKELTFTLLKGVSSDWLLHWSWCKSWSKGWDIFCHVLHCNTRVTTLQWTANCRHNITVHTCWPLYEITCEGGAWEEAALRAWMLLLKPQLTTVQVQNCSQIISLFL